MADRSSVIQLWPKGLRAFAVFMFGASLITLLISHFHLPTDLKSIPTVFIVLAVLAASVASFFQDLGPMSHKNRLSTVLFAISALMISPFIFTNKAFGTGDVNSILMTISENNVGTVLDIGFGSFASQILKIVILVGMMIWLGHFLMRHLHGFKQMVLLLSAMFMLTSPITTYAFRKFVPNPAHALIDQAKDLRPPIITARPAEKKNLILIYLESTERTYRDLAQTAAPFKILADYEDKGISARNQQQIDGVHFTAGGLIGSQCGVPLLPRGMFSVKKKMHEKTDIEFPFTNFLPHLTCLGDVLAEDGYKQSYLNGSDLAVFSKGDFFLTHGFQFVFGLKELENWQDQPRQNLWGLDDDLLFEQVQRELHRLAESGEPFTLSALTISTHGPDAFLDKSCDATPVEGSLLPDAIRCTSSHVKALIDEVTRMGLAEKTVIVLMSDHLAMNNTLRPQLLTLQDQRRNYFTILGAGPARIIERAGTTLDLYPTILEAMGYRLESGRAYMGRSLLAEEGPTLLETLGQEELQSAVEGNSVIQKIIWQ